MSVVVVVLGSIVGAPVGISVVLTLVVVAFLARNMFQLSRARRRAQLSRERQRREFWGFE